MMTEQKRKYSAEFKRNAVGLTETGGRPVAAIAKELGINPNILYRWRAELTDETGTRKAFVGPGNARDEEVSRLRRENADLRETNEILKKAMAIFTPRGPRS